ncbi:MAG: PhoH family protein [Candidatus Palauibacterales bacterium]|nr:PhoH family protein [Candidatus Palauibacterales bacterium]
MSETGAPGSGSVEAPVIQHRLSADGADELLLAGVNDVHLKALARLGDLRVILRSDQLILSGDVEAVERCTPVAQRMIRMAQLRRSFDLADVERFFAEAEREPLEAATETDEEVVALPGARKVIRPKSRGQKDYLAAIRANDIVVGIGPAGTGKTYLGVAMAVDALARKRVRRIILTRPAVEAGEALGFLPGDIRDKVDPYLRPLYDALEDMMPSDRMRRAIEEHAIEIAPLAYMRGRTLSDAFLILDEAQNATAAQMKMFLTRLGLNSRTVITGDKTQIDLPRPEESGLLEIERILQSVEGIDFVYLTESDVVRHRLVKEIIRAYADHDNGVERGG